MLLILHADHEQNCSTSTVRMVGSSEANLFASISAGINALWGPLHGGANQKVIEMLERIRDDGSDHQKYVAKAKDKDDSVPPDGLRPPGLQELRPAGAASSRGRPTRCSTTSAWTIRCSTSPASWRRSPSTTTTSSSASCTPTSISTSGIIYRAMGIPTNMFTVMFALGRLPGWIAHWKEMVSEPKGKIHRPRQIYTGPTERDFVPMSER